MGFIREILGLLFIIIGWVDPLGFGIEFQILFFILGFDFMSLIPKVAIFVMDFFLEFSNIGWILLLIVAIEAVIEFFKLKVIFSYVLKPLAVFMILFVNNISLPIAIIVAGIDLLVNLSKKYI